MTMVDGFHHRAVPSGYVIAVSYSTEKKALRVRFRVGHYEYANVPAKVAEPLIAAAEIPGQCEHLFNSTIEGKYKSTRIGT